MDETITKWIIEFLLRQRIDDSILDCLLSTLPFPKDDSQLKKALLVRRIQTEVSDGTVSETNLELLELVGELDFKEGKVASESMKAAYCAVAVDCTVRFLVAKNYEKYLATLKRIWRGRVQKMENSENPVLISEKLLSWRVDLEAASSDVELCCRILSRNTRNEALKAVIDYIAESWKEMGPSYLEEIAENKDKMAKSDKGLSKHRKEQGFEDLDNVNEAHYAEIPSDKPYVSIENVNESGGEPVFEGLENVNEARNGEIPNDKPSVSKENENVNELGEEQVFEGLENVNKAHNGEILNATQHKQGLSRREHVRLRRGLVREAFYGTGSARIANSEEVDGDTSMDNFQCSPTPEVNNRKEALQPRFVDHNAVVRDPLPEALPIAEDASTDIQRATGLGRNNVGVGSMDKTDGLDPNRVESNKGDDHEKKEECGNDSLNTSDPLEFTEESSPNERLHLPSPKRRNMVPLNIYKMPTIKKRRTRKYWSALEEETLKNGVLKFGKGNWKAILNAHRDIFEDRIDNDLKDKWRNLSK